MNKRLTSTAFIAFLILATSACGWHLRGAVDGGINFDSMHISTADPNSDLTRRLRRQLEASDVEIMENATQATYSLVIVKEDSSRRTATVSASARVSERSLTETAVFLVLDKHGSSAIPRSTVRVERVYEYNEDNVLATNDEAELLKREMKGELARQIYNRLRQLNKSVNPTNPANPVNEPES